MKNKINNMTKCALMFFVAVGFGLQLTAPSVIAATGAVSASNSKCADRGFLGLPTWWRDLGCDNNGKPKLGSPKDVWKIVLNVIEAAMMLAGYVAVGYVIWGGFKYVASDGDESRVAAGKKIITHALIGLFIVLGSVAIVNFVLGLL